MELLIRIICILSVGLQHFVHPMKIGDRETMRVKVKEMFMHAYRNYKINAFPADELMPLSCSGRYRTTNNSRGDIDDALGNFSLTLIDSLDSLFLLSEFDEFELAVREVVSSVTFDSDLDVSVFETNIRILGGLLGGHVSALLLKEKDRTRMTWYSNQLLQMAVDMGNRLLPAFQTSTGIPYPRVNLRHGVSKLKRPEEHTCTACAGTMILEFAALSRLSGNPSYEIIAARAMAALWKQRSRYSDLMGHVINVHSGDWVRRESGVGAGFDSYYEYLLKAYALLGEPVYLHRFQTHYNAIKRFVSGPQSAAFPFIFLDVNMHHPSKRTRSFMDALFAFWPGLQVLSGDVKAAIALHEFLFQVHKRNKLLPEAFTVDMQPHWGEHLLRPELIESTYLLHRATGDPYYLDVGAQLVTDLERYARVPCGFAAIEDVRTMKHMDRLDSYVLAETFKYLYLLFTEPSDLPISINEYLFTTEAHILPLSLSHRYNFSVSQTTPLTEVGGSATLFEVDPHGDRDPLAEAALHRHGRCPSIHFVHHLMLPSFVDVLCDPMKNKSLNQGDPGHSKLMCNRLDLLPHYAVEWLFPKSIHPTRLEKACHAASNKLLLRDMDLIRLPFRHLSATLMQKFEETSIPARDSGSSNRLRDIVPLRATDFQPDNDAHLDLLRHMGISVSIQTDGRLILRHDQNSAGNPQLAVAGLFFVQELINLQKATRTEEPPFEPRHVVVLSPPNFGREPHRACQANFGAFSGEVQENSSQPPTDTEHTSSFDNSRIRSSWKPVIAPVRVAFPLDGCSPVSEQAVAYPSPRLDWNDVHGANSREGSLNSSSFGEDPYNSSGPLRGSIGLVRRGGCLFVEKARNLMRAGAVGGIVVDIDPSSSISRSPAFAMSGDAESSDKDVTIPFVLLFGVERDKLLHQMQSTWNKTGSPISVMLTKEYNLKTAFFASLDQHKGTLEQMGTVTPSFAPYPIEGFLLRTSLRSVLVKTTHETYLPSVTTGGIGIKELSTPCQPDANLSAIECQSAEVQTMGSNWLLMLLVTLEEQKLYCTPDTRIDEHHLHNWIFALKQSLDSSPIGLDCRSFLLSLTELSLRGISRPDGGPPLKFDAYWVSVADACFTRLLNYARFLSLLTSKPRSASGTIGYSTQVSLVLSFQPKLKLAVNH